MVVPFIAAERLDASTGMPIPLPPDYVNAPYVFTFLNPLAADPKFRVFLTNYSYALGQTGSSDVWPYDPISTSQYGWLLKPNPNPPTPGQTYFTFNPPFNFYDVVNVVHENNPYLVVADYDSAGNVGGTLCLLGMAANDDYTTVAALNIANKISSGNTYQAHVQDVLVKDNRIFTLVNYSYISGMTPIKIDYLRSEVREYGLVTVGGDIQFNLVDTVEISKNAVNLGIFFDGDNYYLISPCIGGMQNFGNSNGVNSSVSMVKILSAGGFDKTLGFNGDGELQAYVGHATAVALHDFRSIAISSNGTAYLFMGDYTDPSVDGFTFRAFQTTVSHLLYNAATGKPDPNDPSKRLPLNIFDDVSSDLQYFIPEQTAATADFWAFAICKGDTGVEYLAWARGSHGTPSVYTAYDAVSFVQVGNPYSMFRTVTSADLSGQQQSDGFANNSMAVSVDGGTVVKLRSAVSPVRAAMKAANVHPSERRAFLGKMGESGGK
jgi:hypothetical protein